MRWGIAHLKHFVFPEIDFKDFLKNSFMDIFLNYTKPVFSHPQMGLNFIQLIMEKHIKEKKNIFPVVTL